MLCGTTCVFGKNGNNHGKTKNWRRGNQWYFLPHTLEEKETCTLEVMNQTQLDSTKWMLATNKRLFINIIKNRLQKTKVEESTTKMTLWKMNYKNGITQKWLLNNDYQKLLQKNHHSWKVLPDRVVTIEMGHYNRFYQLLENGQNRFQWSCKTNRFSHYQRSIDFQFFFLI